MIINWHKLNRVLSLQEPGVVGSVQETDFIQKFRKSRHGLLLTTSVSASPEDSRGKPIGSGVKCMNSDVTVQTEVAFGPVSDLGPHMKLAHIQMEKIRLQCHLCCFEPNIN